MQNTITYTRPGPMKIPVQLRTNSSQSWMTSFSPPLVGFTFSLSHDSSTDR